MVQYFKELHNIFKKSTQFLCHLEQTKLVFIYSIGYHTNNLNVSITETGESVRFIYKNECIWIIQYYPQIQRK